MSGRFTKAWLEQHRVEPATLGAVTVIGIGHVTRELDAIAARLTDPARAQALGLERPRGVLLWGDPGTGKTLSARCLAQRIGDDVPVYALPPDELTPERLRGAVKALGAADGYAVLLIDEIDTFALHRDSRNHDPGTRALLSAALAVLDGLAPRRGPLVVATSNRPPEALDPALIRQGRFDLMIGVGRPSEGERLELLRHFTADLPLADDVDLVRAAAVSRHRTPADLKGLVSDAASLAFANGRGTIDEASLREALERAGSVWPEPEEVEEALSEAVRRRMAVHESGHVVVAASTFGIEHVRSVRLGRFGGRTVTGAEDRVLTSERELFGELVVAFAGVSAEHELLGDAGTGSRDDMSVATDLAVRRIGLWLGAALPVDPDMLGMDMPTRLLDLVGADIESQFGTARARAEDIVRTHLDTIDAFARRLADAGELVGDALHDALSEAGFPAPAGAHAVEAAA